MVGTGVFTTSGLVLADLPDPAWVLAAWLVAGVVALAGAVSYGALARHFPEEGGEYLYISRIYHPTLGYLSGWVSILVGFSAPLALAAMAFEAYVSPFTRELALPTSLIAMGLVAVSGLVHCRSLGLGARLQNVSVVLKACLLIGFVLIGYWALSGASASPQSALPSAPFSFSAFGMAVVWISFSYSGFNAAIYIVKDVEDPERGLPRALVSGTLFVCVLYLLFNWVLLYTVPIDEIQGEINIASVVASSLAADVGLSAMTGVVALALLTSMFALQMTGPRVIRKMLRDRAHQNAPDDEAALPVSGIAIQSTIAILAILNATFTQILGYVGILLNLCAMVAISGLFRMPKPMNATLGWFFSHRLCPGLFITAALAMTVAVAFENPDILGWSALFVAVGLCFTAARSLRQSGLFLSILATICLCSLI